MAEEIYQRLARHLDDLPGGFPPTESGVELRILKRLFTEEEAELALHLTLLAEPARVIARRAGITPEDAAGRLREMALKGLIYRLYRDDEPHYMALQYVIGIWEFHVNDLDPELIRDMNEYIPELIDLDIWKKTPQLRTIPIHQDIPVEHEILPYENVEELVRSRRKFAVAPCICRVESRIMGKECDRPEETCLVFNRAADYYVENGMGRYIDLEETLQILKKAEEHNLVLQPSNARSISNICCCCSCCCQVLKTFKQHPQPASLVSSPFIAVADRGTCSGCGTCITSCQMEALSLENELVRLDPDRCIGCGLCVPKCPTGSLQLVRKPKEEQKRVPSTLVRTFINLARARGKLTPQNAAMTALRSARDRLLTGKL